jgi:hypothetical protein
MDHSSLDYKLRNSPLLSGSVVKLLKELETNIEEAYAIVSEARLPYEEQISAGQSAYDENDDDSFIEADEDEEKEPESPSTELEMRFDEIVDIIDNLYHLSARIRAPTMRSRSLKAASYKPQDPATSPTEDSFGVISDRIRGRSQSQSCTATSPIEESFFGAISARIRGRSRSWSRGTTSRKHSKSPIIMPPEQAPHRRHVLAGSPASPTKPTAGPMQGETHRRCRSDSSETHRGITHGSNRSGPWRGRHSHDWLFNGISVKATAKDFIQRRK